MTVSFHKYGDYFPGTGDVKDIGSGDGKYCAINMPLKDGITDDDYRGVFRPIIGKVMEVYNPTAVVLQCGADSLSGDRLGCFNLSIDGHADCIDFVKSYNLPLLILGGGGYTIRNVSRCWAYETSLLVNEELANNLPFNDYYEYYGPDFKLKVPSNSSMENLNSREYLNKKKIQILENLRMLKGAPSVQIQDVPPDTYWGSDDEEDFQIDLNSRNNQKDLDKYIHHQNDFYDDEMDIDKDYSIEDKNDEKIGYRK